MPDIRRLFSVLSRLRGEAQPPTRKVMPLPPQRPLALPAPPKVLALPAPPPKSRAKPRGGQFHPDTPLAARDAEAAGYKVRDRGEHAPAGMRYQVVRPSGEGAGMFADNAAEARVAADRYYRERAAQNLSPEAAARAARDDVNLLDFVPEGEIGAGHGAKLGDWLEKTLAKYYKTDFGTEADPLTELAARGLHYDPDMTPERWLDTANNSLMEDPIGYYTVPRHESEILAENAPITLGGMQGDEAAIAQQLAPGLSYYGNADPIAQGALMQAAPWLRRQPATDMLYGIRDPLDLGHFTDEMRNAMNAGEVGLPADLAVRPEMLERMSFPQAVERVGRINQFRAQELARTEAEKRAETLKLAAQQLQDSPVTHLFKEYPDDPRGLRWVEMAPPKGEGPANYDAQEELQRALKFEGDTMGHCVGGYCPDVMQGYSRIFSLRDAEGMPHVTVETKPRSMVFSDLVAHLGGDEAAAEDYLTRGFQAREAGSGDKSPLAHALEMAQVPQLQNIVQIKGPKNHKPQPEYLPFVQDFVKSGKWGDVGDLRNTDLVRLPDQRFIRSEDFNNVVKDSRLDDLYQSYDFNASGFPRDPSRMDPEDWGQFSHHFEGLRRGGLAVKKCGCMQCGGLAVRRAA
jgi:hypothetical protein